VRVVVDTNVLMSGIFFGGVPGRVIDAWVEGRVEIVLSPEILHEYRRVGSDLSTRYPERATALVPVLTLLAVNATIVDALPLSEHVSKDAADDMFLAAAVAAEVSTIVSGDQHLLEVSGWRRISVLTPRQFVDQYLLAR
jgi:putative PIN family toxin of toxin-antitoxin system